MEEHGPVRHIAALLTNKKEESPICHFGAADETTCDAEWVEQEQEEVLRAESFPSGVAATSSQSLSLNTPPMLKFASHLDPIFLSFSR